jgi:hypothetical protein
MAWLIVLGLCHCLNMTGDTMPTSPKKSITELAAERQRLRDDFNSRVVDDEKIDLPQLKRISTIEAMISRATFDTDAKWLVGSKILMEEGDGPDFADSFTRKLFIRMQEFA